ncbi:MAG: serine/threonine-protein kinase [Phycisphaerales bacterium]
MSGLPRSDGTETPGHGAEPTEGAPPMPPAAQAESDGSRDAMIGPYRLLDRIGVGGFGEVWLAEQKHPIARRVALKIIKPGMDSSAVIARFEQERQALALMNHPHIARVLDAGMTGAGRPYFVMEHIKGEPITEYCDRQRLSVKARLELFGKVCDAIQHAHTKGIIHRDIKPSNILVAISGEEEPRPVVIDFGVAKALAGRLTDKTVYTQAGQLIGTPGYMSPEQAEMSEADIDTRTDVYALGVLLYELLTGSLPFTLKELQAAGFAALQKVIREVDPPRPSTRLSTMGKEGWSAARARGMDVHGLAKQLRGELEWIPLKALRKDRAERYRTAAEMGDDVEAFLDGRPIRAAPESDLYRLRKWAQRHRTVLLVGSASAGIPLLGLSTVVAASNAESAVLLILFYISVPVLLLPIVFWTLVAALRWQLKWAVSSEAVWRVALWQMTLHIAILVLPTMLTLSPDGDVWYVLVTVSTYPLGWVVDWVLLKVILRIGWVPALFALLAQGMFLFGLLLALVPVVLALALIHRAVGGLP